MTREYFPGMGQAVADRTINRKGEEWVDVATRVARGNAAIMGGQDEHLLRAHLAQGTIIMSGRHLQHGDATQPTRNLELFSNCSTAIQRSLSFYLLLNGSGVGSSVDDEICLVDYRLMPKVICTINADHPDADGSFPTLDQIGGQYELFTVPDSREGWAQALEQIEVMAWEGVHHHRTLVLEFSDVRGRGQPIGGMQGRPSSGPVPLMQAIQRIATIRLFADWAPWKQAMYFDHYAAECVLVGGARRAARLVCKSWRDPGILEFITIKQSGDLWSANNSIGVDAEFWAEVKIPGSWGHRVFTAAVEAQYHHGSGEPGFLNLDLLQVGETRPTLEEAMHMSGRYQLSERALGLRRCLARAALGMRFFMIVNPCGEIRLNLMGAYCVIGSVVPFHASNDMDACDAFAHTTRALLRTNMLDAMYAGEVLRTNRIGVGLTAIHEYAWTRFGLGWKDIVAEGDQVMWDANGAGLLMPTERALPFWLMLQRFANVVDETISRWCAETGLEPPTTSRMIAPNGSVAKLFGLTEGAHLPAMREYLRWVQFRYDDPLVDDYETMGYPVRRELKTYEGTSIVGFPTQPVICTLGMGDALVTASEATPEEQFRFLRLLETFWLGATGGNQVSYTLKYDPKVVSFEAYENVIADNMPLIRAISVMPQANTSSYEYLPETPVSKEVFLLMAATIKGGMAEDVDRAHVDCASGACPIDFNKAA